MHEIDAMGVLAPYGAASGWEYAENAFHGRSVLPVRACVRFLVLVLILSRMALADGSAILDELEGRALAALANIPHATTKLEAERQREPLRGRLEKSLGLGRAVSSGTTTALLYVPAALDKPAPAMVIVHPNEALARSLSALGFIVVSLDLRANHASASLLPAGIVPAGQSQRAIRCTVAYLRSRHDVDGTRLGIVGGSLEALIGAAINPGVSVAVLTDSTPDFKEQIRVLRRGGSQMSPDPARLIPGILHYASTEELFALVAPRPILAVNPARAAFQYASDLYSAFGASASLREVADTGSEGESRYAICAWLARWLEGRPVLASLPELDPSVQATEVHIPEAEAPPPLGRGSLSKEELPLLLGMPLTETRAGYGLRCALQQQIRVPTEPGFDVPVTVFRPGPTGCDPERGKLVVVNDQGRGAAASDEIVREELRRGWEIWAVDPRGIGDLKTDNEGFMFAVSLLLGENLVWRQASDIARIVALASNSFTHRVPLYARGKDACLAAAYAAAIADSKDLPEWVVMRDAAFSFSSATDVQPHFFPFDVLSTFDIPDLISAAAARMVYVTRPEEVLRSDWSW